MPDLGGLFSGFFEAVVTLALLFIIVGWVSSKLVETAQVYRNSHGRMLRRELERCFGGDEARDFTRYFYWHPIIEPLTQPSVLKLPAFLNGGEAPADYPPGRLPAYIAPETFAAAMLNPFPWPATEETLALLLAANRNDSGLSVKELSEALASGSGFAQQPIAWEEPGTWDQLLAAATPASGPSDFNEAFKSTDVNVHAQGGAGSLPDRLRKIWCRNSLVPTGLRSWMVALIQDAELDVDRLRGSLARWYGEAMDRVTGRFKREALLYVLLVSFLICLLFNIDAIKIFSSVADNADRRAGIEHIRSLGGSELAALEAKRAFSDKFECLEDAESSRDANDEKARQCARGLLEQLWRNPERASPIGGMSLAPGANAWIAREDDVETVQHYCASEKRSDFCGLSLVDRLQKCVGSTVERAAPDNETDEQLKLRAKALQDHDKLCQSAWSAIWRNPGFFWNARAAGSIASELMQPVVDPASLKSSLEAVQQQAKEEVRGVDEIVEPLPDVGLFWTTRPWEEGGWPDWLKALAGIVISALLAGLGAPFWYDLLGRVSRRGGTGPKPGGS